MARTLGEKLKNLCAERHWDRGDLLDALLDAAGGDREALPSKSTVHNWFNDATWPSLPHAVLLAKVFQVPLEYLADEGRDEVADPPSPRMRAILEAVALLGEEEAYRRLLKAHGAPDAEGGGAVIGHPTEPKSGKPPGSGRARHLG